MKGDRFSDYSMDERDNIICGYVQWYLETYRYAPSVRDIADYLGLQSTSSAMAHLELARRRGRITWLERQPRTITVVVRA